MTNEEYLELAEKYLNGKSEIERQKGIGYLNSAAEQGSYEACLKLYDLKVNAKDFLGATNSFESAIKIRLSANEKIDNETILKYLNDNYGYISNPKSPKRDRITDLYKHLALENLDDLNIKCMLARYCLLQTPDKDIEKGKELLSECFADGLELTLDEQKLIGKTNPHGEKYRMFNNTKTLTKYLNDYYAKQNLTIDGIFAVKDIKSSEMIKEILKNELEQNDGIDKRLVTQIVNDTAVPEITLSYHPILKCALTLESFMVRYEKKVWMTNPDGSGEWIAENTATRSFDEFQGVQECKIQTSFFQGFDPYSFLKERELTAILPERTDYFYAPEILPITSLKADAEKELEAVIDEYASQIIAKDNDWDFKDVVSELLPESKEDVKTSYSIIFYPMYTFSYRLGKITFKFYCSGLGDDFGAYATSNDGKIKIIPLKNRIQANDTSDTIASSNEQPDTSAKRKPEKKSEKNADKNSLDKADNSSTQETDKTANPTADTSNDNDKKEVQSDTTSKKAKKEKKEKKVKAKPSTTDEIEQSKPSILVMLTALMGLLDIIIGFSNYLNSDLLFAIIGAIGGVALLAVLIIITIKSKKSGERNKRVVALCLLFGILVTAVSLLPYLPISI